MDLYNINTINNGEVLIWATSFQNALDISREFSIIPAKIDKVHDGHLIYLSKDVNGEEVWSLNDDDSAVMAIPLRVFKKRLGFE